MLLVLIALGFGAVGIAFAIGTSIVEMTGSVAFTPFLSYEPNNPDDETDLTAKVFANPDRKDCVGFAEVQSTAEIGGKTYTVTTVAPKTVSEIVRG